ncbi:MAG: C-GCAxxG-C-C family protein [Clostridia bacterium]|nr:C-GCAxxG-C-C family protein [Clostridia bacterium]
MMKELYLNGITKDKDLNCAETVLYVCNQNYQMNLSEDTMKLSSAFGGGMCIEDKCGALTAGLMCLGVSAKTQ